MKSDRHKTYTVNNNVNATHNLLNALVATELDAHVVHLGTMGVYGYSTAGASIPEGYLTVDVTLDDGGKTAREILYPTDAGSIYHMTKCLDQVLFQFLRQERRRTDHRSASGHRLGHPHGPDPAPRAAHQPLRLRRRLRHGSEPLPDPGGAPSPAYRSRHRWPEPGLHPHPGLGTLHRDRARQSPGARRTHEDLQPADRSAPGSRPREACQRTDGRRDRLSSEPAQGSGRERTQCQERPVRGPRP